MLKREWQSLLKNKFLVVVVIAIMIIPTIYTTIFLGSMWDPYGEVDKLPVAIVNEDKSVVYNDKTMDVGDELVKNLKENNSLDFNFVDEKVAREGLENGTYYMVVTIPKDFSQNATTLMDDNPKQMQLEYEINPGTNYIASKLSQTAVNKIRDNVQEKITKQYAETIFDKITSLGSGLSEAADGTSTALDGVEKLKEGNNQITSNLELLASSSLEFKDGAETLKIGLNKYTDGVNTASNGSRQVVNGVNQYTGAVNAAKKGSNELENGLSKVNSNIPQLTGALQQLTGNADKLNLGVEQLGNGSEAVLNGLNQMSDTIGQKMNDENKENISKIQGGLMPLNNGIQTMNNTLQSNDMASTTNEISSSLNDIASKTEDAGNTYDDMVTKLTQTNAYNSLNEEQKKEILDVLQNNGTKISSDLTAIGADTKSVANNATKVSKNMDKLKDEFNTIATNSNVLLPGSNQVISSLSGGLNDVKTVLDRQGKTPEDMGLIQGMTIINNGINDESTGLKSGINKFTDGVKRVNQGAAPLSLGLEQLYFGSQDLSNGLKMIDSKSGELNGGVQDLSNGLGTLASNNNTLMDGISKLADGSQKISDGSGKLKDGSQSLGNGLNDLYDGTVKLNDGLQNGANEVNSINATDYTYEMLASPVETSESEMTTVDNNGNAMAPYMMCVGLWVACIALCLMYPLTSHSGKIENGFKWWLSKASILGIVTIAQAVIMVFMLKGINGLNPVELGKTVLIACLASVTFMSIMYFFNILLDKVGSFIMLVFMVLQLGGCAGTYPLQLASKFYSIINPFMPFTYCVHAFRSAIAGGPSIAKDIIVLLSILLVFVIATIVVFNIKSNKIANEEELK